MKTKLAQITNPVLDTSIRSKGASEYFAEFLPRLIGTLITMGFLVFVFFMIVGAIQWIMSGGDKQAIETARQRIFNALIGLIVLFSVFAILAILGELFGLNLLEINLGPLQIGGPIYLPPFPPVI